MGVRLLPTASRLRFEPRPSAPESSTLTTQIPSHPYMPEFPKNSEMDRLREVSMAKASSIRPDVSNTDLCETVAERHRHRAIASTAIS